MAADANLIKGAAAAYGAGTAAKQAGGDALGSMAAGLIGRADARTADVKKKTDEAKERRRAMDDKFFDNQEKALLQGGALGTAEFDLTERKVKGLKKQYDRCALGDDACQRKVMMQLSQESQALTAMKDTRKLNAEAMSTLRSDVTPDEKHIMGVFSNSMSGEYTIDEDALGEKTYTFKMPDGSDLKMPANEVQRLFEKQQDAVGSKTTKDMALAEIERGQNGEAFDEYKTAATFDNLLKDDNSFMSALHDDWGVGNFSASIDKKIANELEALKNNPNIQGLDIPLDSGETNWYENISKEDEALIKQRLMNPTTPEEKEITKTVLKEYYVDAMRQQNEKGVKKANDAALAAQQKETNKYLFAEFKNNLAKDLDGAQTTNDMIKAQQDHLNDLEQIAAKEENIISREDKKKGLAQQAVIDYWNNKVIPKSEKERLEFNKQGPTDKAQHFSREIKTATGDNTINIKYSGKPFTDSSGRQVSGGYYIPQTEDVVDPKTGKVTGEQKQVFQLISEGDNIEATDILSFIKKGSSIGSFAGNKDDLNNAGTSR